MVVVGLSLASTCHHAQNRADADKFAPMESVKSKLVSRLQWYGPMERFNAVVFLPGVGAYLVWSFPDLAVWPALWATFLNVMLLWQGSHYWILKLKVLLGEKVDESLELSRFRRWKYRNLLWFYPMLVWMPVCWLAQPPTSGQVNWAVGLLFSALLEQVNYFHVQLMVDNVRDVKWLMRNRRLKEASLAKDIRQSRL